MGWRQMKNADANWALSLALGIVVFCAGLTDSLASAAAAEHAKVRAAAFDFELFDTSLEGEVRGENKAETKRLAMVSDLFRQLIAESGRYEILDLSPVSEEIEAVGYFRGCNGCEAEIGEKLDADVSITGVVQKVSNLILNINIYVRDVESGELVQVMSADIRSNTDKSWSRGVSWLVRNRLLKQ